MGRRCYPFCCDRFNYYFLGYQARPPEGHQLLTRGTFAVGALEPLPYLYGYRTIPRVIHVNACQLVTFMEGKTNSIVGLAVERGLERSIEVTPRGRVIAFA